MSGVEVGATVQVFDGAGLGAWLGPAYVAARVEWDYVNFYSGQAPVPTEARTWGKVKALFSD